ncbi:uncharacterized protein DS421_16g542630 [Arachis hypogaea]|nr:uncharacterized protein DS421_16g542630 [Arachis hypogaea]
MSEPKKAIVHELGFGGLMHIPPMNMPHKLLKELANSFKLGKSILETSYGSFKVKPKIIEVVLGINASGDLFPDKVSYKNLSEENKLIFRRFQGNTMKKLTDEMMSIGVENEQDWLMFKRIFILYIQMAFLLPKEDSEEPRRKQLKRAAKKMESKKRKQILEDSSLESQSESTYETQSEKRKHIIEDSSSEEENPSYDGTEIGTETIKGFLRQHQQGMLEVSLATETDPLFQGQMEQSSVNKPSDSIVPIQLCLPSSQATSENPVPPFEPSPQQREPQKVDESTLTMPPALSKIDPAPEATDAALLMMARTASYIPKELPLPSFSIGLTDSSQEETQTQ